MVSLRNLLAASCPGSVLQRMPGLTEFLAWADAQHLPSAAVTNAPKDNALMMIDALRLQGYFKVGGGGGSVGVERGNAWGG